VGTEPAAPFTYLSGGMPPVTEVRPGIWSLPVPMPGPLRYVYAYALACEDGVLLIDAGPEDDEAFGALEQGLAVAGYALSDVEGMLFTHGHHDHYGLTRRLLEATGSWTALHPGELHELDADAYREYGAGLDDALRALGVTDEERGAVTQMWERVFGGARGYPRPHRLIADGDTFPVRGGELVAVHTPGHSPGHVCFVHESAGVAFVGDHVLSLTTPSVGLSPGSTDDPLGDYLRALERVLPLGDMLGLPGHEDPLPIAPRARALVAHHDARLREVVDAIAAGHDTVRAICERMTWSSPFLSYGPFDFMLALREALAHITLLERRGELEPLQGSPMRWRLVGRLTTSDTEPH
jgi:glyoxylase-like metal-dependent hydrolase (beta-lactamase superfamily II)